MKSNIIITICAVFIAFVTVGCLDDDFSNENLNTTKSFNQKINIENSKKTYVVGDTIWINAIMPDSMTNYNSGNLEKISNASFIFSGELYLLKPLYDSLRFLENNFDIVISEGSFDYDNVVDGNYSTYFFNIKFGRPAENYRIRFGIVPKYLGAFSFEATSVVYYGDNRTDYNDYSQNNNIGYLDLYFNLEDINASVYNSLPSIYRQNYDYYYTYNAINAKVFYFFDVAKSIE